MAGGSFVHHISADCWNTDKILYCIWPYIQGEDSKTYQIDVELPGVKKSDMTVRVDDNNRLMIEAKKETESTEKKGLIITWKV